MKEKQNKYYLNPFFCFVFILLKKKSHTQEGKKEKEWLTMCCSNEEKKTEREQTKIQFATYTFIRLRYHCLAIG